MYIVNIVWQHIRNRLIDGELVKNKWQSIHIREYNVAIQEKLDLYVLSRKDNHAC